MTSLEWLERGNQLEDPIDAFSSYWRGFNNLFFQMKDQYEREKIKSYIVSHITPQQSEEILNRNLENIAYLLSEPVIDMRGNGRSTAQNIATYSDATDKKDKLCELFMIIYQVRCNLEHGSKSPTNPRDTLLCLHYGPLIRSILELNH